MTGYTERLRLEEINESHALLMFPVLEDDLIYRYIPDTRCSTVEELKTRYLQLKSGSSSPGEIWWNFILFRSHHPAPIGFVQATLMPEERLAEVAYVLSPEYWGQGYATEALAWLIGQVAHYGNIDTVQAQIDERNLKSISVVRRLGFYFSRTVVEESSVDSIFERPLIGC
jgi:ribosomal-protein-alanine N-acetyltransferase